MLDIFVISDDIVMYEQKVIYDNVVIKRFVEMEKNRKKEKRSRQKRRSQVSRRRLLTAAREVFAEKGLDLTRIDEITERADLGKGTFYNHFSGKEDIIQELIKDILDELSAEIKNSCKGVGELEPLLDTMIEVHTEFFRKRWEDYVLYFQGRADLHLEKGYSGIDTPFLKYLETIEDLIDTVINRRLSKTALRRIGCAVAGFVSGYYSFAVISIEGEDVDKTLDSLRSALVAGLVRFVREALPSTGSKEKGLVTR